jgi:hypothetical protein
MKDITSSMSERSLTSLYRSVTVHFFTNLLNCIKSCIQQNMQENFMCKCDGQRDIVGSGACHTVTVGITVKHSRSDELDHYVIGINYPRIEVL